MAPLIVRTNTSPHTNNININTNTTTNTATTMSRPSIIASDIGSVYDVDENFLVCSYMNDDDDDQDSALLLKGALLHQQQLAEQEQDDIIMFKLEQQKQNRTKEKSTKEKVEEEITDNEITTGLHAILRKGSELLYNDDNDDDNDDDDNDNVSPLVRSTNKPPSSSSTSNTTYKNKTSSGLSINSSTTEDGDSLNNSMSLTDLHTTTTTTHDKNHHHYYNNNNRGSTSGITTSSCDLKYSNSAALTQSGSSINSGTRGGASSEEEENPLINPPNHFICPISHQLFVDPVIDTEGNTYERDAILRWLILTPDKSPITGNRLRMEDLVEDRVVKNAIDRWKKECWVRFLLGKTDTDAAAADEDDGGEEDKRGRSDSIEEEAQKEVQYALTNALSKSSTDKHLISEGVDDIITAIQDEDKDMTAKLLLQSLSSDKKLLPDGIDPQQQQQGGMMYTDSQLMNELIKPPPLPPSNDFVLRAGNGPGEMIIDVKTKKKDRKKSKSRIKEGGIDVSDRSGKSSKSSSGKKSTSSKTKKKTTKDGSALGGEPRSVVKALRLVNDLDDDKLDTTVKKGPPTTRQKQVSTGSAYSNASHISGASQVSSPPPPLHSPTASGTSGKMKKNSKSPYRKNKKLPPPPPPPKEKSTSSPSASAQGNNNNIKKASPSKQRTNNNKATITSSQKTIGTSNVVTTPTTTKTVSSSSSTSGNNIPPLPTLEQPSPISVHGVLSSSPPTPQKKLVVQHQDSGGDDDDARPYQESTTSMLSSQDESSSSYTHPVPPVRDIVPTHTHTPSSGSSFCSQLSANFSDMMSMPGHPQDGSGGALVPLANNIPTRTRPQHNGWSVPLGVHKVICAMPGLHVTTQVHRRSIPIKVTRTNTDDGWSTKKVPLIIPPGSYIEILETQVHGERVRGRILFEEEVKDEEAMFEIQRKKNKKTIKKRISRQIKRTSRRGRGGNNKKGDENEIIMKTVQYEGWISLQWAKDDDDNDNNDGKEDDETKDKSSSSGGGKATDEDMGPWTEPVPLGVYRINFGGGLPLRETPERDSPVKGKLVRGRCVEVVQTQVKNDRVRARVIVPNLPSQDDDDDDNNGGKTAAPLKFTSGWISLLNALTGSSGASLVPLGAYVVVAEPGCVITEGGRLDSKIKGKLAPGSCLEVVATRMEEGVVRGLVEGGGHVTLFAPPRGGGGKNGNNNNNNGRAKPDNGRMFAMPVPLGTYQIIQNGLSVTSGISVTSSTLVKLQSNKNVEIIETRVENGRVRGRICSVLVNEDGTRVKAGSTCTTSISSSGGSSGGGEVTTGWINLFEPNQRWAKIVTFKGGRPVSASGSGGVQNNNALRQSKNSMRSTGT